MWLWVALGLGLVYVSLLAWYLAALARHDEDIPLTRLSDPATRFHTGDLVLYRHVKYKFPWFVGGNRIVSHLAVLWEHPEHGACVIDMNPERFGPFDDTAPPFPLVLQAPAIMVYKLEDMLRHYPGEIFLRRLKTPLTAQQQLAFFTALVDWALQLDYEPSIKARALPTYLTFTFSIMTEELARPLSKMSSLSFPRTASFCSELIGELLARAGVLTEADLKDLHIKGPISWISGVGSAPRNSLWYSESLLVL